MQNSQFKFLEVDSPTFVLIASLHYFLKSPPIYVTHSIVFEKRPKLLFINFSVAILIQQFEHFE